MYVTLPAKHSTLLSRDAFCTTPLFLLRGTLHTDLHCAVCTAHHSAWRAAQCTPPCFLLVRIRGYVCICTYVCTCGRLAMCGSVSKCSCSRSSLPLPLPLPHTHTHTHTHKHTHTHTYTHIQTHTYTHNTHTHTTHTHTHTHAHNATQMVTHTLSRVC